MLPEIKRTYSSARIKACCENKCKLVIPDDINYVILKGELLTSTEKMCDCVIFRNDKRIILVELMTKNFDVKEIAEKFTNAGKKALEIAGEYDKAGGIAISCLLLVRKRKRKGEFILGKILSSVIRINGRKHIIIRGSCGCSLYKYVKPRRA